VGRERGTAGELSATGVCVRRRSSHTPPSQRGGTRPAEARTGHPSTGLIRGPHQFRGWPSHWSCVGPQRDVKPCLSVPVLMRSLLGWQEDEVDRLPGRPVCTLEAHEASHGSSACRTRRLKTRPAPPGLAGPATSRPGHAARPAGSVAQRESANAVPHP